MSVVAAARPPKMAARGHGADEHARVGMMAEHADAVAENCAAGVRAGWIHRDNAHRFAFAAKLVNQLIGQRALSRTGRAGDADHGGLARCAGTIP